MYGHIFIGFKLFVKESFGEETWVSICKDAGVDPMQGFFNADVYDDCVLMRLASSAVKVTGHPMETCLEAFGGYLLHYYWKRSMHSTLIRILGRHLYGFLCNLDTLHSHFMTIYPEMIAPSFRCERFSKGLFLHYYSSRSGLAHLVKGIVQVAANDFFKIVVNVKILYHHQSIDQKLEHYYIFEITPVDKNDTKKLKGEFSSMGQFYRTVCSRECSRASMLSSREASADLLAVSRESSQASIRRIPEELHIGVLNKDDLLKMGCGKQVHDEESGVEWPINVEVFDHCFPFFIIFNHQLVITHMGSSMASMFPEIIPGRTMLLQLFEIERPLIVMGHKAIRDFRHHCFILSTKAAHFPHKVAKFRGQMVALSEDRFCPFLFVCSPLAHSEEQLEAMGLSLDDLSVHDIMKEVIELKSHLREGMDLSNQLERAKHELEVEKARVQEEKARADVLLHSMLPPQVASELKSTGASPHTVHPTISILFSDIENFSEICGKCSATEIVALLNQLFTSYDSLVENHNVYKVETIGDCYMVAAGLPNTSTKHAEATVNMAFEMRSSVACDEDLKVRFGIHSGPVVAGVIGTKMPRYCLFGDTVNIASRMESTGETNKIHISHATYQYLQGKPYNIQSRGLTFIKGLGYRETFFVEPLDLTTAPSAPLGEKLPSSTARSTGTSTELEVQGFDSAREMSFAPPLESEPAVVLSSEHGRLTGNGDPSLNCNVEETEEEGKLKGTGPPVPDLYCTCAASSACTHSAAFSNILTEDLSVTCNSDGRNLKSKHYCQKYKVAV